MISKELLKAYKATDFIFYPDNSISIIKVGKTNKVLDKILRKHKATEAAFITPWNPKSKNLSYKQNQKRMKQIIKLLEKKNQTFIFAVGRSPDGKYYEDSLLVLNIKSADAMELGRKFGQNAIVTHKIRKRSKLVLC